MNFSDAVEIPELRPAEVRSEIPAISVCAVASFGLTVLPTVLLLFLVLSIFITPPPSWLTGLAFLSPVMFLPGFVLGCFATWECRRKASLRGVELAVMGVMAGYFAVFLWWTCFASAFIRPSYAANGSIVIAVIGILWSIVDRSKAPKVVVSIVLAAALFGALFSPMLLQQREAARRQTVMETLRRMGLGIKLE